jgi:hypothetical protein
MRIFVPEKLGREARLLAGHGDAKVKMPRASPVEARLHGAEFVGAILTCEELSEPGKIRVRPGIALFRIGENVLAMAVRVPELNQRVVNRLTLAVQNAPAHVGDET